MRKTVFVAAMLFCAAGALGQTTQPSWELKDNGRWQQVAGPATAAPQEPTLDLVERMIQSKQAEAGKRIVVAWLKANVNSPVRDRGIYLLGQANYAYGDHIMSFYNFDELMDKYPESRYYYPSLERQYDIADAYLRGWKDKFLGMAILDRSEEATEMLYRIQQRAPGSPLAEKALLRVSDYYYSNGDYDIAADAYAAYVRGYPRSPLVPRARLKQAFATLAQFRGIEFDATPVIDARRQLLDLAVSYPKIAEEENVQALVARIDEALAKKLLSRARYYRRTHKPTASVYYLRYLIGLYPNSPEAQIARKELPSLPKAAQENPQPPGSAPLPSPTTRPIAPKAEK
jgi:outer membrane assembly lipoprotein YfiO